MRKWLAIKLVRIAITIYPSVEVRNFYTAYLMDMTIRGRHIMRIDIEGVQTKESWRERWSKLTK